MNSILTEYRAAYDEHTWALNDYNVFCQTGDINDDKKTYALTKKLEEATLRFDAAYAACQEAGE